MESLQVLLGKIVCLSWVFVLFLLSVPASAATASSSDPGDEPELIQLYTQDELNVLINEGRHLERIKIDECQFTRDIKARALILNYPAYLYLWADMNFTSTCISGNAADGVAALKIAAEKGMPAALYKMGSLYLTGTYVQKDYDSAYRHIHTAASLGHDDAKLTLVNLLATHDGNEGDYVEAYRWLYRTVFADSKRHELAETLLSELRKKMPASEIRKAESVK